MLASVEWLNSLLSPGDLTADEAEAVLTYAGFPIETREPLPGGDERLDVEITSNRGDCISHVGLAREISAATARQLILPTAPESLLGGAEDASSATSVENTVPARCPRFTARVIRGVRVGPSPDWLVRRLEAIGQRSINNVVDATNYILFELGHPTHVFDLARLQGGRIIVRHARDGETLETLDGRKHTLKPSDVVVADAERAVSLAGIMGGEESSVTERTTDILLEAATWDPSTIRRTARRLGMRTDASHRYERIVDPRTTPFASARLATLIVELAGGAPLRGMVDAPGEMPQPRAVRLRAGRCRDLLGEHVATDEMARLLTALDIDAHVDRAEDALRCDIPAHRPDLVREIDLVEEVARTHGYERIGIDSHMRVAISEPQPSERAVRDLAAALAGMGFFETITYSFLTRDDAAMFCPDGARVLAVDEERRAGAPALRPSVVPSLLACRRVNQDSAAPVPTGGVRLFEISARCWETGKGAVEEERVIAFLMDAPDRQEGLRAVRGALEALARRAAGADTTIEVRPVEPRCAGESKGAIAEALLDGAPFGRIGVVSPAAQSRHGLELPCAFAEVSLEPLVRRYPPRSIVTPLPAFPSIERDLSVVVDEAVPWRNIADAVAAVSPAMLEHTAFVGVYRGKQLGAGRKSVTLRMTFRAPDRTLRHDEVDPQVESVVASLAARVGGALRQ